MTKESVGVNGSPGIDIVGFELEEISLKSVLILSFYAQNNSVLVNVPWKVLQSSIFL